MMKVSFKASREMSSICMLQMRRLLINSILSKIEEKSQQILQAFSYQSDFEWLVLDRFAKAAFLKPYWTSVALEMNNRAGASLRIPRPPKWIAKV